MGGPPPFGYSIEDGMLVENTDTSQWVKRIFDRYLSGWTIQNIREELDKNSIKPRHKKNGWSVGSLQKMLRNTFYIGHYTYHDKKLAETVQCECPSFPY